MMNKKAESMPLQYVIGAAILLIFLAIVVYGLIKGIFLDTQITSVKANTEYTSLDCDEDGVIGYSDQCPCVGSVQKLDLKKSCGSIIDPKATTNCPNLCKKR